MKKFLAILFLSSSVFFVGCGEETTGDKVDKAIESGSEKADDMKKKASEALDN